jgi:hypothetical protein
MLKGKTALILFEENVLDLIVVDPGFFDCAIFRWIVG